MDFPVCYSKNRRFIKSINGTRENLKCWQYMPGPASVFPQSVVRTSVFKGKLEHRENTKYQ